MIGTRYYIPDLTTNSAKTAITWTLPDIACMEDLGVTYENVKVDLQR